VASRHDVRSLAYGVRPTLAGSAPLTDHLWPVGPVLDQGAEGECVGCAVVDAATTIAPPERYLTTFGIAEDAARIYKRAQQLDEVPGEDYAGTSVLAGMKAGVEAGLFGGYRWAFGTRDVAQAVLQVGPVVVGVPWLSGMYDTGPGGLVPRGRRHRAGSLPGRGRDPGQGTAGAARPLLRLAELLGPRLRGRRARLHPSPRPRRAAARRR
jgi:hypothetical protein